MSMVSLPPLDVSAAPVYNQVRQEQIAAEQECVERVQQPKVKQMVHVPVPQVQEQIVEGIKEVPQERFPELTVEQVENTPIPQSVEETAEAVQIIPQEHFQGRTVEQIVDAPECVGDTSFHIVDGLQCEVIRIGFRQLRGPDPLTLRPLLKASAPAFEDLMKILTERKCPFLEKTALHRLILRHRTQIDCRKLKKRRPTCSLDENVITFRCERGPFRRTQCPSTTVPLCITSFFFCLAGIKKIRKIKKIKKIKKTKKSIARKENKEASKVYSPETAQKNVFSKKKKRNVKRNRAAIEVNMKNEKRKET